MSRTFRLERAKVEVAAGETDVDYIDRLTRKSEKTTHMVIKQKMARKAKARAENKNVVRNELISLED